MSQVSITDIAAAAGVSPSTVSRALQDHPRISPARRQAIQALAQQMGYRPSQVARSLVTGRTRTLGVVITDVTDPFVAEVMKGAELASRESGYTLLFAIVEPRSGPGDRGAPPPARPPGGRHDRHLRPGRLPVCRAAQRGRGRDRRLAAGAGQQRTAGPGIYSVRMDNVAGAHEAVSYLRRLGHRRIAFVSGPEGGRSSAERLAGYRQGIAANGLRPLDEIVVAGAGLLEDGPRALEALLGQADPPTAVLCYNDLAAIGLLAAAARAGLRVPDDLAVIGYDNIPLSAFTVPALTTVDQPKEQMGRSAVTMCLQALAGEPVRNVVLKGRLILRDSAGADGA